MERVLRDLACHDKELSILFIDDVEIESLNERYLEKKRPTNVLAFPMLEPRELKGRECGTESAMLGDVVISVETAQRESERYGEPLEKTVDKLLIHGILHLLGYDHEVSEAEAKRMEREEKRLIRLVQD